MPRAYQMETILKEAGFTKIVSLFYFEPKDPSRTKTVTEELQENKEVYSSLSTGSDIVFTPLFVSSRDY